MKLIYNVLWIDDRQRQVETAQNRVREKLARLGFELKLTKVEKVNDDNTLKSLLTKNEFDLLVVDFKMQPDAKDGSELIKTIRRYCTATDIAFYSSETPKQLRTKIDVDGVYCYSRNNLPSEVMHLIDSRLKKLLDLNQMRGVYLAAVADFDHLIDEIIHCAFDKIDDGLKLPNIEYIISTALSFHEKKVEEIKALNTESHINQYTNILSSNPKITLLLKILSELDDEQLFTHLEVLRSYTGDILVPRNKLAHSMEVKEKSGVYTLKNNKKEFEFNMDDFLQLRHKVLDYKDTFENIKHLTT
ncbi:MAG: CheY-like chemotaxis protein [Marinomonas primoryensis]|jgi:CheY-like chemotaxis protein